MHAVGTFHQSFEHLVRICFGHILDEGVRNDGGRVISYHTIAVAWTGPFGEETTFEVCIQQTFLHLLSHRRIDQVDKGEETTEGIPETCISEHVSGQHLAVIRTIVDWLSVFVIFIEHPREEDGTIVARVESTESVDIIIFHFDTAQCFVPSIPCSSLCLFKVFSVQLFHISFSLFETDERRGDASMYLFTLSCHETNGCSGMIGFQFQLIVNKISSSPHFIERERLIEDDDKIVLEVFWHTATIARVITDDFVL